MKHPVLPFHVGPHATLTLAEAIRLIASTKGPDGASVAGKWPRISYPRPSSEDLERTLLERKEAGDSERELRRHREMEESGISPSENNVLNASAEQLFRFLSGGDLTAFFVPSGEVNPVEISARTWGFHGYDAVRWQGSGIKTGGSPINDIKVMADDVLRLIEEMACPNPLKAGRPEETSPKKPTLRRGRPSYREDDRPLIEEMHKLITERKAKSMCEAAKIVAPRAQGIGVKGSTIDRLRKGYSTWRNSLEIKGV